MLRDKSDGPKSEFNVFSDKYAFLFIYTERYCPTNMISPTLKKNPANQYS